MAVGTRLRKEREWRERLARFRRAGTSVVQFCEDEGVSTPTFYAWRKRLGDAVTAVATGDTAGLADEPRGRFAPVRLTGISGGQVTVKLRGGTRLEIPLADANAAAVLIGAILHADAEQAGDRPC